MMSEQKYYSNFFMNPNAMVDELMALLTNSELRVLLFMIREITGWQSSATTNQKYISQSIMENGYIWQDSNGNERQHFGCGIGKGAIKTALKGLKKYRIVKSIGKPTNKGQKWELTLLTEANPDTEGLINRANEKSNKLKEQTKAAREANPIFISNAVSEGGSSTTHEGGSSTTHEGGSSTTPNNIQANIQENKIITPEKSDVTNSDEKSDSPPKDNPTKKPKKRDILFELILFMGWGINYSELSEADKKAIESGRVSSVKKELMKLDPQPEEQDLRGFFKWYKKKYPNTAYPKRPEKFVEHFLEYRQSETKTRKSNNQPNQAYLDMLAEQKRLKQLQADGE